MGGGRATALMWTLMPGQTWLGAAASFTGMGVVMLVAMMLPSLAPTVLGYRGAVRRTANARLSGLAGAGYFAAWAAFGAGVLRILIGDNCEPCITTPAGCLM